jgi:hypothetical protein
MTVLKKVPSKSKKFFVDDQWLFPILVKPVMLLLMLNS